MRANELRIGNYVDCFGIKTVQSIMITPTGEYKLELNEKRKSGVSVSEMCLINSLDLKPISLTEEWLLKFGFTNYYPNYWSDKDQNFRFALLSDGLHCSISGNNSEQGILFKRINYVHELQNLYFALTGKELI